MKEVRGGDGLFKVRCTRGERRYVGGRRIQRIARLGSWTGSIVLASIAVTYGYGSEGQLVEQSTSDYRFHLPSDSTPPNLSMSTSYLVSMLVDSSNHLIARNNIGKQPVVARYDAILVNHVFKLLFKLDAVSGDQERSSRPGS
jgi:hypothetical protein